MNNDDVDILVSVQRNEVEIFCTRKSQNSSSPALTL